MGCNGKITQKKTQTRREGATYGANNPHELFQGGKGEKHISRLIRDGVWLQTDNEPGNRVSVDTTRPNIIGGENKMGSAWEYR